MLRLSYITKILGRIPPKSCTKGPRCISAAKNSASLGNFTQQQIWLPNILPETTSIRGFKTCSALFSDVKEVEVPQFADSISEGDINWVKAVGDFVEADEAVGEVETDKTTVPLNAPFSGTIVELLVEDGTTVKPGMKVFKMKAGEGSSESKPETKESKPEPSADPSPEPQKPAEKKAEPEKKPESKPTTPPPQAPMKSIPVAAIKHSTSLNTSQSQVKVPPEDYSKEISGTRTEQRVKMSRMRQRIAQRLKEAQNTNAMLTTFNEVDMGALMDLRKSVGEQFLKKFGFKLGFMSAFIKASAYALQELPVVNAVIDEQEIIYRDYVDISVAVATPKGLVVPVIRNVEGMNYADIERTIIGLGQKAKDGALAVEDMDGGTFTISNGGVFGSMFGTPIINPPQSAILGMHGIFDRPVARGSQVVVRPMMYIALTYDHRLIDGREAVTFLKKIKTAVEDPRIMLCGL